VEESLAYLPLFAAGLFPLLVVCASIGSLVGVLAARIGKPLLGSLVGTLIFGGVSLLFVLSLPRHEPWDFRISILVFALTIGHVAGGLAAMAGGRGHPVSPTRFVILRRLLLFMPAVILLLAWELHDFRMRRAEWRIEELGGSVGWDAVSEPNEYYRVDLRDSRVDDRTLQELSGSLACYRRLDLNLDQCPITDEGLESLADLENLERIHLRETHVTQQGIARLKDRLPGVEVDW
jgi:hypothetical protein